MIVAKNDVKKLFMAQKLGSPDATASEKRLLVRHLDKRLSSPMDGRRLPAWLEESIVTSHPSHLSAKPPILEA